MSITRDVRYAVRSLAKSPTTTVIAVLALALGIGANTSTLSGVVSLLLRPYPFPESERIVALQHADLEHGGGSNVVSTADFLAWREESASFERMAAFTWSSGNLGGVDEPERLRGGTVSPSFFPLLRTAPALGRVFLAEEEQPGRDGVIVLGHGLWQRRFGGQGDVLGRSVSLDDRSYTVVGVMPRDFEFPIDAEYWTPLTIEVAHRQMELLSDLHRGGATACMVTHDTRFARHADRTIHLFDGQIVDEEGRPETIPGASA